MLLIDLGNTRLKWRYDRGATRSLEHSAADFDDRWSAVLAALPLPSTAWLSSVADPAIKAHVCDALVRQGITVRSVEVQAQRPELKVGYSDPKTFGVDRWLALLAARRHCRDALLLVSCGTALTVDLVDAGGQHWGGLIAPSPAMMEASLRSRIRHLPAAALVAPDFASNTAEAIAGGCDGAAVALIEHSLRRAQRHLHTPVVLFATGGGMPALLPLLETPPAVFHPDLVLEGLALLIAE